MSRSITATIFNEIPIDILMSIIVEYSSNSFYKKFGKKAMKIRERVKKLAYSDAFTQEEYNNLLSDYISKEIDDNPRIDVDSMIESIYNWQIWKSGFYPSRRVRTSNILTLKHRYTPPPPPSPSHEYDIIDLTND